MSGALRHWHLGGMDNERWVPVRTVCELKRLKELHASMGDIRLVVVDGGDNAKLRFELSRWGRCARCAQGHSSGSGVRPDFLPIARELKYPIRGTSLSEAHCITKEGLREGGRLHVHLYEWERKGK